MGSLMISRNHRRLPGGVATAGAHGHLQPGSVLACRRQQCLDGAVELSS